MKRALLLCVLLAAHAVNAATPGPFGTKESYMLHRMFTPPGYFGFPGEAAAPFTCDSNTERSSYYDTVLHSVYVCNGTSWTAIGGVSSPIAGAFVATGKWTFGSAADAAGSVRLGETASCVVFEGATANAFETSLCVTDPTGTRVATIPDSSFTFAGLEIGNTWTGAHTFTTGSSMAFSTGIELCFGNSCLGGTTRPVIKWNGATTPDSLFIGTGSTSNSVQIGERADIATDLQNGPCGTAACTHPTLIGFSASGTAARYWSITHNETNGVIAIGTGGLVLPGMVATAGTAPAVSNTSANSCGTNAATLAGTDATGIITVGATSGTSCTVTFVVAAPTRRQCWANNETTANLSRWVYLTTTTGRVDGTFVGGDVLSYGCIAY